ncbi:hypothetical protein [Sphingobacterium hotanense]|uniref:Uncharacterized protein n=1 Tax=Sphingobacterium hotanense TaxID=649196 RepID=A0ABT7NQC7_9SPHI|nr:hypothetical protein [Sphingobacterium hotanense]MDM1049401.1 hypothetical protein [Sphingobacterium hotanense]
MMNKFLEKQNLLIQLSETENLLNLSGDHPFMSIGLRQKVEKLRNALENLNDDFLNPTISLLFSGNAVSGSLGIKSSFLGKVLNPIQDMIKTQTAELKFNRSSKRGRVKGNRESEMYLTSLPVGSFGVELSHLNSDNLFSDLEVSNGLENVSEILKKTTESDEAFAEIVSEIPARTLNNLRRFLKEVADEDSIIKMYVGNEEILISKDAVKLGYDRVKSIEESEELIFVEGVLKGILLDANKFEFVDNNGERYNGKISDDIDTDEVINFTKDFLNEQCTVQLLKKTIILKGDKVKFIYTLNNIDQ